MQKELNEGTTLVIDRYAYSGVAYTAAKEVCSWLSTEISYTAGLNVDIIEAIDKGR